MTAAEITAAIGLTAGEAEAIARARAALDWIRAGAFPWACADSGEIHRHAAGLRGCLDDYADLTSIPPRAHPADLFPDLGRGQDNALEVALDLVTQDIRDWTAELVRLATVAEEAARAREEMAA